MSKTYISFMVNKVFLAFLLCVLFSAQGYCQPIVESCDLKNGHNLKLIQQLDKQSLANTFSIDINGATLPALLSHKGVPDLSVEGDVRFSACINNVYLLIVDTGSVRLPGVVVRFNGGANRLEKIYFSQKGNPRFIQSTNDRFSIIFDYVDYAEEAAFVRITYTGSVKNSYNYDYLSEIKEVGLLKIPDLY